MYKIGVVGCGFVGHAVEKGFSPFSVMRTYDIDPNRCANEFGETVDCDFVFVCLPTPMIDAEGGEANLEILEDFFEKVAPIAQKNESIYIIKSTVPIGTTRKFSEQYGIKRLVHNPEFLTAKNALTDFLMPARSIVGGQDEESVEKVRELLSSRFPNAPCYTMESEQSEMVKYVANCFLATKVIFFNEMKLLADKLGIGWDDIIKGVISDGRIGRSHYQVPGPDGSGRGFGGTCVLPNAKLCIINRKTEDKTNLKREICTIKELYNKHNKILDDFIFTESCDAELENIEFKQIIDVTKRSVDEELFVFDTENGEFVCTKNHLMPVFRNNKKIIIKADKIKDTDLFFSK